MLTSTSEGAERRGGELRLGMVAAGVEPRAGLLTSLRRLEARHPEGWVLLAAAGAWVWMAVMPHAGAAHGAHPAHGAHHAPTAPMAGPGVLGTAVMVIAMMLPLTVGSVRQVARSGRWEGRHRAVAGFLAGYLGVWMVIMLAIAFAWSAAAMLVGWMAGAVAVTAIAALWEIAPGAWRQMRGGRPDEPMASVGWRADAACARFGAGAGGRCGTSCWALMAACVAVGHSVPVMAALFGVQLSARYPQRPVRVLAALAVIGTCAAAIVARSTSGPPG